MPRVAKTTKTMYDLTRKGRPFNWGEEQQDSFEEIKCRLMKLPVLHMPNKTGNVTYIQTIANLQWVVHYARYKMVNLN